MDIEKLQKLAELKEKGFLTQEEFEKQKRRLMDDSAEVSDKSSKRRYLAVILGILCCLIVLGICFGKKQNEINQSFSQPAEKDSASISSKIQKNIGLSYEDEIRKIDEQIDALNVKIEEIEKEIEQKNPDGLNQEKNQMTASLYDNILSEFDNVIKSLSAMSVDNKVLPYKTAVIDWLKQKKQGKVLYQKALNKKFFTYSDFNQLLRDKDAVQYMKDAFVAGNELDKISFHKDEIKNEIQGKPPFYKTKITKDYYLNNSREGKQVKQYIEKFGNLPKEIEIAGHYASNVGIALIGYEEYTSL